MINIFNWLFLKNRKTIFDMMKQEEEYNYICPKCEKGIHYKQQNCKTCKSKLTWIENPEETKDDNTI